MSLLKTASANEVYAWAAGIIDGEGCISLILRSNGNYSFGLSVGNNDPRVISTLYEAFGGSCIEMRLRGNRQRAFQWRTNSIGDGQRILKLLRPYLVVKGEEADVVLNLRTPHRNDNNLSKRDREKRNEVTTKLSLIKRDRLSNALRETEGKV